MGLNDIELKKTAILYFDTLKGYWYTPEGTIKSAIKPMVDNSIRLMKAGRAADVPIRVRQRQRSPVIAGNVSYRRRHISDRRPHGRSPRPPRV